MSAQILESLAQLTLNEKRITIGAAGRKCSFVINHHFFVISEPNEVKEKSFLKSNFVNSNFIVRGSEISLSLNDVENRQ